MNKTLKINLGSFDLIKGVAIIFVVLGHMMYFYDAEQLSYYSPLLALLFLLKNPLMPLFFIISGYGFKEKRTGVMLKATFRGLIIPYLWVMLAFCVAYPIGNYIGYGSWEWAAEVSFRYFLAFLLGIPKSGHWIWGYEALHCSAVWFFLASFIALNLLNLIVKARKPLLQICLVTISILVGYFLILRDINYYCIPQGLMALGYCYIGYIFKKYNLLVRGINCIWVYALLLALSIPQIIWGHMNLCLGEFNHGLWDYFGSGVMAILLLFVGIYADRLDWSGLDWIKQIGVYTYWILCIHVVEDGCMQWERFIAAFSNPNIAFVCEVIIKIIILTAGCWIIKKVTRYRYRRRRVLHGK